MVNNNFSKIISLGLGGSTVTLKSYSNEDVFFSIPSASNAFKKDSLITDYENSLTTGCSILIGSGNTAATVADIKLDSIISNYTVIAQTHSLITGYSDTSFIITRTIQNTNSDPLTISEIGLFGYTEKLFMFAREVLAEPVVLQPGEKHPFTMTIGLE